MVVVWVVAMLAATVASIAPVNAQVNPGVTPPVSSGVVLEISPWATIPDASNGRPRLNSMATIDDRLFISEERDGHIYELTRTVDGGSPELFFDLGAALAQNGRTLDANHVSQSGLRGIAFHPEFGQNGLFYTSLMETRVAGIPATQYLSDVATPIVADSVLIEWQMNVDTGRVSASSYREIFRVGSPVYDHTIKQIRFNQFANPGDEDYGLLYIAHGDGDRQTAANGGGQDNDALGKILRIDPRPSGNRQYTIPPTNPFVGDPSMMNAVYSLGHRNPHHLAFAETSDGDVVLISAETGRDNIEEVNIIEAGGNYGWGLREGTFVFVPSGRHSAGTSPLPANEASNGFTFPAAQVSHTNAALLEAIAGGFVANNGSELDGHYLYADFAVGQFTHSSTVDELAAAVTLLDPNDPTRNSPDDLTQAPVNRVNLRFDHDANPVTPALVRTSMRDIFNDSPAFSGSRADVRFGQGPDGELYITSKRNGQVYLITNSVPANDLCNGRLATVFGTSGSAEADVIIGTGGVDQISAGGGDDIICARGGADQIDAGAGNDFINAGWGSDVIRSGGGDDVVLAGPGLDDVEAGSGNDIVRGGRGGDRLVGNGGNDTMYGAHGRDRVFGYSGNDALFGGPGDDNLRGGAGVDVATGGAGTDQCVDVESSELCES